MAKSDRTGIFRVDVSSLHKPPTSFTKKWPESLGERIEEGWAAVFPNLLSASHVCLAVDERGCVAAHDCRDAGPFIGKNGSPAFLIMHSPRGIKRQAKWLGIMWGS